MLFKGDIREYWREKEQEKCVNLDFIEGRQSHSGFVWIFLKSDWTLLLPQAIAPYSPVHKYLLVPSSDPLWFALLLVLQVYRLPVQDCHKYSDCEKCTQARDPYCGWCVREGR